jgi:hypothetical protein
MYVTKVLNFLEENILLVKLDKSEFHITKYFSYI